MQIKPCPDKCQFDWVKFHDELDKAIAHMIDEQDILPSKTSMMTLMEYSNGKKELQQNATTNTKR